MAITRPPKAAVLTAAHPPLPANRIGTVTTAASAATSSPARAPPSATARERAAESSSSSCHVLARMAHWLPPRRPNPATQRATIAPHARGLLTRHAEAEGAQE